jgi:hypothetical protein
MKKQILLALVLCSSLNIYSQVTIGSVDKPAVGVLLDLNSGRTGGLTLSKVVILDLEKIPADNPKIFPGIVAGQNDADNGEFTGALVYNTNAALPDGEGVYVWNGKRWDSLCRDYPQ